MKVLLLLALFIYQVLANQLTPMQIELLKNAGFEKTSVSSSKKVQKEQEVKNDIKEEAISNIDENEKNIESQVLENKNYIEIEEKKEEPLKRFALNFFNNQNKIDPYSIPTPEFYRLSNGDSIKVSIFGSKNEILNLDVNRNGKVDIPNVGELKLLGLQFKEVKSLLKNKIKDAYPSSTSILIDMDDYATIQVSLTGLVKNPGLYNLTSFSTIKDALSLAGGILPEGSYRNIKLKRAGITISNFDLYSLIKYGKNNDKLLQTGDVIFVDSISKKISLKGEINTKGIYELKSHESFKNLFSFASGLKAKANKKAITLKRYKNNKVEVKTLSLKELYKIKPSNGDELVVNSLSQRAGNFVKISGNVQNDLEIEIPKDRKLSSLFKELFKVYGQNSIFKTNTDFYLAKIENLKENKVFNLKNILDGKDDLVLSKGDNIIILSSQEKINKEFFYAFGDVVSTNKNKYDYFIGLKAKDVFSLVSFSYEDNNEELLENNLKMVDKSKIQIKRVENNQLKTYLVDINENPDFLIHAYDEITFFDINSVNDISYASIRGEIFIPNEYPITKDMTINKLIELSGGFTKKALKTKFELVRYITVLDERKRIVEKLDLKKAIDSNMKIHPDDEITILGISNWLKKEYITLEGEVRFPGRYAVAKGEKLASVIKRAGGFTNDAFLEGTVFTREEVRLLQEKRLHEAMDRLKRKSLQLLSMATEAGQSIEDKRQMTSAIDELESKVESTKPIGRVSINLYYDLKRFEKSDFNITIKDKDRLYIPRVNDTVSVVGEVLNQNTFIYSSLLETSDYLSKAGGITEVADEEMIYIVKANGEAVRYEKSFFFGDSTEIFKGDTIVVPLKFDTISDIKYAKDVTSILYQLAVTAASLKTVGAI